MALLRSLGALTFVLGVALLALDAARALNSGIFEATSVERFWDNLSGNDVFQIRLYFADWFGPMSDKILELPAAFVMFGFGMMLLIGFDGMQRNRARKPMLF